MANIDCATTAEVTAALTAAVYGDAIRCPADTVIDAPQAGWTCPVKSGYTTGARITITTQASSGLPAANVRIGTAHLANIPRFRPDQAENNQNSPVFKFARGAKGWKFKQIELRQGIYGSGSLLLIGQNDGGSSAIGGSAFAQFLKEHQPEDIDVEQVYINGLETLVYGLRQGIGAHGKNITIQDSWIRGGTPNGSPDSSGIGLNNGQGPVTVINTHIEGWTYGFISGGGNIPIKSAAIVAASPAPTTTSMRVTVNNGGDAPVAGQVVGVICDAASPVRLHPIVASGGVVDQGGGVYDITFEAPTAAVPVVGTDCRWGVLPTGITIQKCLFSKPHEWRDNTILATPANASATATTGGTLTAGTYQWRVNARAKGHAENNVHSTATTAQSITVAAGGALDFTWDAVPNADSYVVYVLHPDGTWRFKSFAGQATTSGSYTANGSTGSAPSGNKWSVKNAFEIKYAKDVLVEDFVIDGHWRGVDNGYAVWIKSVNQPSSSGFHRDPMNWTDNVTIRYGKMTNVAGFFLFSGCEFSGSDQTNRPKQLSNVLIHDIVGYNSGGDWRQGSGNIFGILMASGGTNITIRNCTLLHPNSGLIALAATPARDAYFRNFVYRDNLGLYASHGVKGSQSPSSGNGSVALEAHSQSNYTWTKNATAGIADAGHSPSIYPDDNLWPTTTEFETDYFEAYAAGDLRLKTGSPGLGAGTAGGDLGADVAEVNTRTAIAVSGDNSGAAPNVPTIVTGATLTGATVGVAYSTQLQASGGDLPRTWSRVSGDTFGSGVLAGLSLNANTGVISGTPTTAGTASVVIQVADATPDTAQRTFSLTVAPAPAAPLSFVPGSLPEGTVNVPYSAQLAATGGTPPYAFTISPDSTVTPEQFAALGLTLDSLTGEIAGTPLASGSSVVTFQVSDSAGGSVAVQQTLTLTIASLVTYSAEVGEVDNVALAWQAARTQSTPTAVFEAEVAKFIATIRAAYDKEQVAKVEAKFRAAELSKRTAAKTTLGVTD